MRSVAPALERAILFACISVVTAACAPTIDEPRAREIHAETLRWFCENEKIDCSGARAVVSKFNQAESRWEYEHEVLSASTKFYVVVWVTDTGKPKLQSFREPRGEG